MPNKFFLENPKLQNTANASKASPFRERGASDAKQENQQSSSIRQAFGSLVFRSGHRVNLRSSDHEDTEDAPR